MEEIPDSNGVGPESTGLGDSGSARRINEIVHGERRAKSMRQRMAACVLFQDVPTVRLGLQLDYDLDLAEDACGERLDRVGRRHGGSGDHAAHNRTKSPIHIPPFTISILPLTLPGQKSGRGTMRYSQPSCTCSKGISSGHRKNEEMDCQHLTCNLATSISSST